MRYFVWIFVIILSILAFAVIVLPYQISCVAENGLLTCLFMEETLELSEEP